MDASAHAQAQVGEVGGHEGVAVELAVGAPAGDLDEDEADEGGDGKGEGNGYAWCHRSTSVRSFFQSW